MLLILLRPTRSARGPRNRTYHRHGDGFTRLTKPPIKSFTKPQSESLSSKLSARARHLGGGGVSLTSGLTSGPHI